MQLAQFGAIAANEVPFEITADQVRQPDVALMLRRRPREQGRQFQGVPELAIEIVSESDDVSDLDEKIDLYLAHGARAVWVVWPGPQRVDIHQSNQPTRHYTPPTRSRARNPCRCHAFPVSSLFV